MDNTTIEEGKTMAIVSYITIIGTIIALSVNMERKNKYTSFHVRQALGLNIMFYVISFFIGYFDSWMISGSFYVFFIVLWGFGLINAIQGENTPIPLIGATLQDWFKSI